MRTASRRPRRTSRLSLALVTPMLLIGGCQNAGEGALSGGAIGALGGLAIGSLTGSAGKGAAIGAIGGAIVGGVRGDQNRRANERQQEMRYDDR